MGKTCKGIRQLHSEQMTLESAESQNSFDSHSGQPKMVTSSPGKLSTSPKSLILRLDRKFVRTSPLRNNHFVPKIVEVPRLFGI